MNIIGIDLGIKEDNFSVVNMKIKGSYKAPSPLNVVYVIKNWKSTNITIVKKDTVLYFEGPTQHA